MSTGVWACMPSQQPQSSGCDASPGRDGMLAGSIISFISAAFHSQNQCAVLGRVRVVIHPSNFQPAYFNLFRRNHPRLVAAPEFLDVQVLNTFHLMGLSIKLA